MFQSSIKKFAKRLVIVSMAVCAGLWFAGCGSKEKEEEKKEEDPLKVMGGELTKGGDGKNDAVTVDNLDDFIAVFLSALTSDYSESGNSPRGKRALLDEYYKGYEGWKGNYKIIGDSSGYVEITHEGSDEENETRGYEGGSQTCKFFDFSNTNKLFLGGAVGYVDNWEEKNKIGYETIKYNGTINFQGAYKGKVVFENVVYVDEYTRNDDWDRVYTKNEKSGKFYVESNGQKINLPDSLVWYFIYPSSNKNIDYGDMTLNTNVPVPAAPNGNLTERVGTSVSENNVAAFFEAFNAELYEYYRNVPRATEIKTWEEELTHGKISGYFLKREDVKGAYNNSGEYGVATETMKYDDYSNEGRLYFGGGYGKLSISEYHYDTSYTQKDTITINGKVKFNGEFKGELNFKNFKYKYENYNDSKYKLISGKVMIGSYYATQKYMELVIRQN